MMDCDLKRFFLTFFLIQIHGYIVDSAIPLAFPIALPNCRDQCNRAGVRVPYPFWIGKGCYKNKWFKVVCNHSSFPSLPFLPSIGLQMDDLDYHVDVTDSRLRRVQKNLAVMNRNMRSGCSCMSMLLSVLGIVGLAVVIWLLVKYL